MRHKSTKNEQEAIIEKAIQLLKNDSSISLYKLYILATRALGVHTAVNAPWFNQRIKKERELINQPVKQQESVKQQEPVKQQEHPIHQIIDEILLFKNNLEIKLNNLKEKIDNIEVKQSNIEVKQNNLEIKLKNIEGITSSYKRLLENILGDLTSYHPEKEEVKEKEFKLKIGVVGPLKDQYNEISYKIENKAKLEWLDKERNLNIDSMKKFDYIIVSRHCKHNIYWDAKLAIGENKVFRIATGGIQTISDKIIEIINNERR